MNGWSYFIDGYRLTPTPHIHAMTRLFELGGRVCDGQAAENLGVGSLSERVIINRARAAVR